MIVDRAKAPMAKVAVTRARRPRPPESRVREAGRVVRDGSGPLPFGDPEHAGGGSVPLASELVPLASELADLAPLAPLASDLASDLATCQTASL